jgi:D-3-phosphoglycerate dehydrogenase
MVATAAQLRAVSPAALPLQQLRTKTRFALSIAHITPAGSRCAANKLRAGASDADEVSMLEKMLKIAKERKEKENGSAASPPETLYDGKGFTIKTFNAISAVGLDKFPKGKYVVAGDVGDLPEAPMGIMLRSHKLQLDDVPPTVRGIVRCGAGTNNIPVKEMTERGIPVFNTPGANANAVKELVICGLLLASRGIIEGNNHVNTVINTEEAGDYERVSKRIEADKSMFGGKEIEGKTLGVIGLGAIGSR